MLCHIVLILLILHLYCYETACSYTLFKTFVRTATSSISSPTGSNSVCVVTVPKRKEKIGDDVGFSPKKKSKDVSDIFIKESRDIEKEFEEFIGDDLYLLILYNDNFNKRQYVANALMLTLSWDEPKANEVMMMAHEFGWAVCGEYNKELAFEYRDKLLKLGIYADVQKEPHSEPETS